MTKGDGTGALASTTSTTYDNHGNVGTVTGPLGTAQTTKYRYDSADQLVGTTLPDPDGAGPLTMPAVRLTYRADGQVSKQETGTVNSQSDADWAAFAPAHVTDIGFDSNSRPITSQLSAGGTAFALTQTSYDAAGRLQCTAVSARQAITLRLPLAYWTERKGSRPTSPARGRLWRSVAFYTMESTPLMTPDS